MNLSLFFGPFWEEKHPAVSSEDLWGMTVKTTVFFFFGWGQRPVAGGPFLPRGSQQENNFQGGVHIVPKDKVKEIAEKMLGKTPLGNIT